MEVRFEGEDTDCWGLLGGGGLGWIMYAGYGEGEIERSRGLAGLRPSLIVCMCVCVCVCVCVCGVWDAGRKQYKT